ncbi:MAG: hypothetical protein LBD59_03570 [Prevotellaceae bacterium]|nr:hypothetical protein [Prevotellaceae bacterium]
MQRAALLAWRLRFFASRRDASLGRNTSYTRICIPQGCILTGCRKFFGNRFYRAMQSC